MSIHPDALDGPHLVVVSGLARPSLQVVPVGLAAIGQVEALSLIFDGEPEIIGVVPRLGWNVVVALNQACIGLAVEVSKSLRRQLLTVQTFILIPLPGLLPASRQ